MDEWGWNSLIYYAQARMPLRQHHFSVAQVGKKSPRLVYVVLET
jgi:hypothetical protein